MAHHLKVEEARSSSGITKTGLEWVNFPGYDKYSDGYKIAAAVVVPAGRRLVATSGHVGRDSQGNHPKNLEEEYVAAFEVSLPFSPSRSSLTPLTDHLKAPEAKLEAESREIDPSRRPESHPRGNLGLGVSNQHLPR
jgi:hypothetical protein